MADVRRIERPAEQPDRLARRERRQAHESPLAPHVSPAGAQRSVKASGPKPTLDQHAVAMLEFLARAAGAGLVAADPAPGRGIVGIALGRRRVGGSS